MSYLCLLVVVFNLIKCKAKLWSHWSSIELGNVLLLTSSFNLLLWGQFLHVLSFDGLPIGSRKLNLDRVVGYFVHVTCVEVFHEMLIVPFMTLCYFNMAWLVTNKKINIVDFVVHVVALHEITIVPFDSLCFLSWSWHVFVIFWSFVMGRKNCIKTSLWILMSRC